MPQELRVITDYYELMLWLIQRVEKFPRHHRHSLGVQIENRLHLILGLLLEAKYTREKRELLSRSNIELEILRFQLRLAQDLKVPSLVVLAEPPPSRAGPNQCRMAGWVW